MQASFVAYIWGHSTQCLSTGWPKKKGLLFQRNKETVVHGLFPPFKVTFACCTIKRKTCMDTICFGKTNVADRKIPLLPKRYPLASRGCTQGLNFWRRLVSSCLLFQAHVPTTLFILFHSVCVPQSLCMIIMLRIYYQNIAVTYNFLIEFAMCPARLFLSCY